MNTVHRIKLTQSICALLILLTSASLVCAYPPDNAAVLYYRACLIYDANDMMTKKVSDLVKGNIGIDEEIKGYVQKNKFAIKYFVDAADAPNCDWGMDYSEGFELYMPQYAPLRVLSRIVLAKAKITADSGDYKQALELCLSTHKASPHIAEGGVLVSYLVGISINAMANQCIIDILPHISDNPEMLIWFKNQIYDISQRLPSVKTSINIDLRTCSRDICKEKAKSFLHEMTGNDISEKQRRIILNGDDAFFKASKEYFLEYLSAYLTAVDLSYPQSYEQLEKLAKKPAIDSKKNHSAIMATYLAPAISRVVSTDIKTRTQFNAVKTALNLYIIRAKTGQFPDALPENMPRDLFSDKDFKYEKTDDGFILRCQGKDLSKDEIYEYKFKVKK
jgi:hypothetical protein